jgi:OPA family sugar phosphate sensor protein UhpC-like MFS transporter
MSQMPKLFGPDRRYERWRWQIFGITWLAYVGFYLTRKSFAAAKIALATKAGLSLTDDQMAQIDGANLTAYAVGMVIWGICGDRFGTRKVILFGMVGSILAAIAMGSAKSAGSMVLCYTLQGLFQSTGWAPLSKNVTNFFSQHERGVVMGMWCTNYALGGFVGVAYAGWLGDVWGWRASFFVPALTLLGIFILFVLMQRNRPEDVGLPAIEEYHNEPLPPAPSSEAGAWEGKQDAWQNVVAAITNPMVLLLAAIYFCLKPARYAILNWGPMYINERLGFNMTGSGLISGLFELAGPISVIAAGIISDKVFGARRMPVSVICLFLLGILLLCLDRLPHTGWMLGAGLFLMGILTFAPDSLISGTAAVDFGTRRGASTASGLINGAGSLGAIYGGTMPGFFRKQWGWEGVFTLLAASVFLAAILLLPKWNAMPPTQKK